MNYFQIAITGASCYFDIYVTYNVSMLKPR